MLAKSKQKKGGLYCTVLDRLTIQKIEIPSTNKLWHELGK
jgi:hypothetical protein